MIIAVTGGRDYWPTQADETWFLERVIDLVNGAAPPIRKIVVVLGDCPTGVDAWVQERCATWRWLYDVKEANWTLYGKSAGPRRNAEVLRDAHALIAFPGGRGTRDAVSQARRKGIPVVYHGKYTDAPMKQ